MVTIDVELGMILIVLILAFASWSGKTLMNLNRRLDRQNDRMKEMVNHDEVKEIVSTELKSILVSLKYIEKSIGEIKEGIKK